MTWVEGLGGNVTTNGTLAVLVGDSVEFDWSSGHNIYRSDGDCSQYSTVGDFSVGQEIIENDHPGENPYHLSVPSVTGVTSYCYACITHYGSMKFTLRVSPAGLSTTTPTTTLTTTGTTTPDECGLYDTCGQCSASNVCGWLPDTQEQQIVNRLRRTESGTPARRVAPMARLIVSPALAVIM